MAQEYTRKELQVLWFLKRHGGKVEHHPPFRPGMEEGIVNTLATELDIRKSTIGYVLRGLEQKCLIIRTYFRSNPNPQFGTKFGYNPLVKVEMCDPNMWLPELPGPMPLGVVMNHENTELYERLAEEPSMERTLAFVLDRLDEYKHQIDTLRDRLIAVDHENEELKRKLAGITNHRNRPAPDPLKHRVAEHLTAEEWDALYHPPREN